MSYPEDNRGKIKVNKHPREGGKDKCPDIGKRGCEKGVAILQGK